MESERTYVAPALTFALSPDTTLTLLSYYQKDKVTGDGGGFLPAFGVVLPNPLGTVPTSRNLGEPGSSIFDREQYAIGYDVKHAFNDTVAIEQNLKFFSNNAFQTGPYGTGLLDANFDGVPDDYRTVTRSNFSFLEDVQTFAVDTRLSLDFATGNLQHEVLIGVDYRSTDNAQSSYFGAAPSIDLFNPVYGAVVPAGPLFTYFDQTQEQTGIYVQDQIRTGGFVLSLAGRQDWLDAENHLTNSSVSNDKFTGRIGLNYVFDNGIAPYVAYATSFQPVGGADFNGNVFVPSEGEQIEAGVKYDGRSLAEGIDVFASFAVYQIVQSNVLTPDPAHLFFNLQTGEVEVQGVEIEATARFHERLSLNFSYGYTDSEVTRSLGTDLGKQLTMTPRHKASLFADYTFQTGDLAGLGAGLGVRYMGESYGDGANQWRTSSQVLWDATIHYDFDDWRIAATANNLFDAKYVSRCSSSVQCFYGTRGLYAISLQRSF